MCARIDYLHGYGATLFSPDRHISGMAFFQVTVVPVITEFRVVGPIAPYRTGRFNLPGELKEQQTYPLGKSFCLFFRLAGKGDCPVHIDKIYPYKGYCKTVLWDFAINRNDLACSCYAAD